jgi:hypothetical protein
MIEIGREHAAHEEQHIPRRGRAEVGVELGVHRSSLSRFLDLLSNSESSNSNLRCLLAVLSVLQYVRVLPFAARPLPRTS